MVGFQLLIFINFASHLYYPQIAEEDNIEVDSKFRALVAIGSLVSS